MKFKHALLISFCFFCDLAFAQTKVKFGSENENKYFSTYGYDFGIHRMVLSSSDYMFYIQSNDAGVQLEKILKSDMSIVFSKTLPVFNFKDIKFNYTKIVHVIPTKSNFVVFSTKSDKKVEYLMAHLYNFNGELVSPSVEVAKRLQLSEDEDGRFQIEYSKDSARFLAIELPGDTKEPQPLHFVVLNDQLKSLYDFSTSISFSEVEYKKLSLLDFHISNNSAISFLAKPVIKGKPERVQVTKLVTIVPDENKKVYYNDIRYANTQIQNERILIDENDNLYCYGSYLPFVPMEKNELQLLEGIVLFKMSNKNYSIEKTTAKPLEYEEYCKKSREEIEKKLTPRNDVRNHFKAIKILNKPDGSFILLVERQYDISLTGERGNTGMNYYRENVSIFDINAAGEFQDYVCFPKYQMVYYGSNESFDAIFKNDKVYIICNMDKTCIDEKKGLWFRLTSAEPQMFLFSVDRNGKIERFPINIETEGKEYFVFNMIHSNSNGNNTFSLFCNKYKNQMGNSVIKDLKTYRLGLITIE